MIDFRKLRELVRLMVENDLSELDLRDQAETVLIKRPSGGAPRVTTGASAGGNEESAAAAASDAPSADAPSPDDAELIAVESPMVGTFYSSPSPDAEPFVRVGSNVTEDTTLCLIEAMKVFNEIKAQCSGRVEQVLVKNGDAVEFGQRLYLIRPA